MKITLQTGFDKLKFTIPGDCTSFSAGEIVREINRERFTRRLTELIKDFSITERPIIPVAIVVADKTRLSELRKFLPWIEQSLTESPIPDFTLDFFIAYGSHPRQSESESREAYGDVYTDYTFIHHDSRSDTFADFGTTTSGTRILINDKLFGEHDLVITFGSISHHYFAGFGGGRKLLFPGLAEYSSILHNHSLYLDFQNRSLQKNCRSGVLEGNPVAEDLEEIHRTLPPTIGIHTLLNSHGEVCRIEAGADYGSFEAACQAYSSCYKIHSREQFDLVIASAGGFPKDINFIQAHKSIHTASGFVKNGGKLILLAECRDGLGNSRLHEIFGLKERDRIFPANRESYENNTGTVLAQLEKAARIDIHMITSLDEETCGLMGTRKILHAEAQDMIGNHSGSMAIIENASLVF